MSRAALVRPGPLRAALVSGPSFLSGEAGRASLPRRRFSRPLLFSLVLHLGIVAWLVGLSIHDVGPVPPPPLSIRFFASAPPAPRLVPLRERQAPFPREAPRPRPTPVPPLIVQAFEPAPREQPRPAPIRVEPDPPPIRVVDAAPAITIADEPPPPGAAGTPQMAPVQPSTLPQAGTGEEPEVALLVPGEARARGAGGGIAGKDLAPIPPSGDPDGPRRGSGAGGGPGGTGIAREKAFTATGLASYLSQRYGVSLLEASRLGSRTSDGARYALLLPALSEAYRSVPFRGRRRGAAGEAVESVQVDADAIVIRYRDGTLHVLAPTGDGLVALFVSSRGGASSGSKVREAERALAALHRFASGGAGREG